MPLTSKGQKIMSAMQRTYGDKKKAEQVFYASRNAGRITGVEPGYQRGGLVGHMQPGSNEGTWDPLRSEKPDISDLKAVEKELESREGDLRQEFSPPNLRYYENPDERRLQRGGLVAGLVNHDLDPDLPRVSEDVRIEPVAQLPAEYSRVIQQLKEGARQPPAVPVNRQRGGGVTAPPAFKRGQAEVNYRRGYPLRQCGVCVMYWHRHTHQMWGGCTQVHGNITPYGLCDLYRELRNPFGPVLSTSERKDIENHFEYHRTRKGIR